MKSAGGPVAQAERINSLDAIRGVAILGILPMNALSFGLSKAAYFNMSAGGVDQPLDWLVGVMSMVFVDQKMMALFSLLFGVGVVVFADRAKAKGRRSIWLSLWRFVLLLGIGIIHGSFWYGDILTLYAICAPIVLLARRLPNWLLSVAGVLFALAGTISAPYMQGIINVEPQKLGKLWFTDANEAPSVVQEWFLADALGRSLGLMLIGVVLYRLGIVQGGRSESYYRNLACLGIGVGTVITGLGVAFRIVDDWSVQYALVGHMPTGLATIPMALGYMAVIILWNNRNGAYLELFRNAGKMALTNYLSQTILGLAMLGWLFGNIDLTRSFIAIWIIGVWGLQLWWSNWWLSRYRYGPLEWVWRCLTYRSWQPILKVA